MHARPHDPAQAAIGARKDRQRRVAWDGAQRQAQQLAERGVGIERGMHGATVARRSGAWQAGVGGKPIARETAPFLCTSVKQERLNQEGRS